MLFPLDPTFPRLRIRSLGALLFLLPASVAFCGTADEATDLPPLVSFVQPAQQIAHESQVRPARPGTTDTISLRLTDNHGNPTSGSIVMAFPVIEPAGAERPVVITPLSAVSAEDGSVEFQVAVGDKPGRYVVAFVSQSTSGTQGRLNRVEFVAQPPNWADRKSVV